MDDNSRTTAGGSKKLDGVSNEAVARATGRDWDAWLKILNRAGAKDWTHKEIVAHLKENHDLSAWWQQTVTVAYEKANGRRVVGQTADTGFQVGVQRTLKIDQADAWNLITSRAGLTCWLGKAPRFRLAEGKSYRTADGIEGEVRVVREGERVRLTWKSDRLARSATVQIALASPGAGKTSIKVHMENLPSQAMREKMKSHWQNVLDELRDLAAETAS